MQEWSPSASDIKFCENLTNVLKDGGVWGTSLGTYVINKIAKTLTLVVVSPFASKNEYECIHMRNKIAFEKVGYTVTEVDLVRKIAKERWKR